MKTSLFVLIACLGLLQAGEAQNYDHIWMSGYESFSQDSLFGGTVYDFNYDSIKIYKEEREMNFDETIGIICDSSGSLQFYSNGLYIANMNNDTMDNGVDISPGWATDFWSSFLSGGSRLRDGIIVLPDILNSTIYHFFQLNISELEFAPNALVPNTVLYSKIDMDEQGGLGAVVLKNKVVHQSLTTRLSDNHFNAVRHANGIDWWVIVFEHGTSTIVTLLFTNDTLITVSKYQQKIPFRPGIGQCEFSQDGEKFASGHIESNNGIVTSRFQYLLFDRCTGIFTPIFIDMRTNSKSEIDGVAFSKGGRYLFEFYHTYIFRYDTEAADIFASKDTIAEWDGFTWYTTGGIGAKVRFGYGELGPDENIYCFSSSAVPYFHRINYPDDPNLTTVDQHILLPTINSRTVPHFPNYKLGPWRGVRVLRCSVLQMRHITN